MNERDHVFLLNRAAEMLAMPESKAKGEDLQLIKDLAEAAAELAAKASTESERFEKAFNMGIAHEKKRRLSMDAAVNDAIIMLKGKTLAEFSDFAALGRRMELLRSMYLEGKV